MKKFIWVIPIICGLLVLPACNKAGGQSFLSKGPIVTPSIVDTKEEGFKVAYPKIKLLTNEGVIETWPQDCDYPGRPDFNIKKGEPLCIFIENTDKSEAPVNISYIVPDVSTTDIDTNLAYLPAPEGIVVTFSARQLIIPPQSISRVPLRIEIPKIKDIPKRWEFDIHVTDDMSGSISVAENQRWLITMR